MFDTFDPSTCKVALLAGGSSGEREISLASGRGASAALKEAGFAVSEFDPASRSDLTELMNGDFDIAFLCLHGRRGEDGAIQGFLETIGLPYTGSGICASALAIDKGKAKIFYRLEGINTPESVLLEDRDDYDTAAIVGSLGTHCVVKPVKEGSSLGVFIVEGEAELDEALQKAFGYDDVVLVERYVAGRELTVAVLGSENPEALPIIEIIPRSNTYDFDSKYAPGGSQHICPAEIPEDIAAGIRANAVRAHKALGCSGASRTDFLLDANGVSWVLETNTIPGMTPTSLLPDAARAAGMSFPELCTRIIAETLAEAAA